MSRSLGEIFEDNVGSRLEIYQDSNLFLRKRLISYLQNPPCFNDFLPPRLILPKGSLPSNPDHCLIFGNRLIIVEDKSTNRIYNFPDKGKTKRQLYEIPHNADLYLQELKSNVSLQIALGLNTGNLPMLLNDLHYEPNNPDYNWIVLRRNENWDADIRNIAPNGIITISPRHKGSNFVPQFTGPSSYRVVSMILDERGVHNPRFNDGIFTQTHEEIITEI